MPGILMREYFKKIYKKEKKLFEKELYDYLKKDEKKFIITANPETLMIGNGNKEFDRVLQSEDVTIVPDGIGVVKAARFLGYDVKERITGVELCKSLMKYADKLNKSIYFFGAKPEVVQLLVEKVKKEYPNITISGYTDGYVENKENIMEKIIGKSPDIVLVALGIPQQELLISRHYPKAKKGIFVGVGGSFDVLSGTKKRAPEIFIKMNLEWLYRIAKEPKRIKRFLRSNIIFLAKIVKMKREK